MNTDKLTLLEVEVNDWLAFASTMPYDTTTRAKYKAIRERICTLFRDYRAYMVKDAKVAELPMRIIQVCERTKQHITECRAKELQDQEDLRKELFAKMASARRDALVNLIVDQKEDYIAGFDTASAGIRAWDCLVDCIRSGHITRENLVDYGIRLDVTT